MAGHTNLAFIARRTQLLLALGTPEILVGIAIAPTLFQPLPLAANLIRLIQIAGILCLPFADIAGEGAKDTVYAQRQSDQ